MTFSNHLSGLEFSVCQPGISKLSAVKQSSKIITSSFNNTTSNKQVASKENKCWICQAYKEEMIEADYH